MDTSKDIIMICKKHYNCKFESTQDALKAYISKYSGTEIKYIGDLDILLFLLDTAKIYLKPYDWLSLIQDGFMHDIQMASISLYTRTPTGPDGKILLSYEYLIDKLITCLTLLNVKTSSGDWAIDLSEYGDKDEIV